MEKIVFALNKKYPVPNGTYSLVQFNKLGAVLTVDGDRHSTIYVPNAKPKDFGLVGDEYFITGIGQEGIIYELYTILE